MIVAISLTSVLVVVLYSHSDVLTLTIVDGASHSDSATCVMMCRPGPQMGSLSLNENANATGRARDMPAELGRKGAPSLSPVVLWYALLRMAKGKPVDVCERVCDGVVVLDAVCEAVRVLEGVDVGEAEKLCVAAPDCVSLSVPLGV